MKTIVEIVEGLMDGMDTELHLNPFADVINDYEIKYQLSSNKIGKEIVNYLYDVRKNDDIMKNLGEFIKMKDVKKPGTYVCFDLNITIVHVSKVGSKKYGIDVDWEIDFNDRGVYVDTHKDAMTSPTNIFMFADEGILMLKPKYGQEIKDALINNGWKFYD